MKMDYAQLHTLRLVSYDGEQKMQDTKMKFIIPRI